MGILIVSPLKRTESGGMNNLQLVEKVLYYIDDHVADGVEL